MRTSLAAPAAPRVLTRLAPLVRAGLGGRAARLSSTNPARPAPSRFGGACRRSTATSAGSGGGAPLIPAGSGEGAAPPSPLDQMQVTGWLPACLYAFITTEPRAVSVLAPARFPAAHSRTHAPAPALQIDIAALRTDVEFLKESATRREDRLGTMSADLNRMQQSLDRMPSKVLSVMFNLVCLVVNAGLVMIGSSGVRAAGAVGMFCACIALWFSARPSESS